MLDAVGFMGIQASDSGILRDQGPGLVGSRADPPRRGLDGQRQDLAGRSPPGTGPATRAHAVQARLAPGSGTAGLGQAIFEERCASCHGETGEDPKYSRLVGGQGTLATDKPIKTIGSFWQYATTLWSYIRRAQPFDDPGSLTPDQVYAVTAYLLHRNGIIGEQEVMDATTLPRVKMPNRDG